MDFINKNREKIFKFLFVAGTLLFIYLTVNYIFWYVAPFAFGFLFSLMLEPLAKQVIKRLKTGRGIAALVCILVLVIALGVLFTGIISQLISQARAFVYFAVSYINSMPPLTDAFQSSYNNYISFLPEEFQYAVGDMLSGILTGAASALGSLVRDNTGSIASTVASFFLGLLLMLISVFFFIKDKFMIRDFIRANTPEWLSNAFTSVRSGVAGAFLGYMKSQLFLIAPTAVICVAGLFILRYPYALFVGLVIAIFDMLPILGAGMILGPWAVFSIITGNLATGVGLIVMYVLIITTRQILEPKIIGQQIGLHPLITLMSIYVGLRVFGIFGFVIGPMTVVIIKALIYGEHVKNKNGKEEDRGRPK